MMLFGLFAGVVADRVERRRLIVVANSCRVAVLAGLVATIATGEVEHRPGARRDLRPRGGRDLRRHQHRHAAADARRQARPRHRERPDHRRDGHAQPARRAADRGAAVRAGPRAALRHPDRVCRGQHPAGAADPASGARRGQDRTEVDPQGRPRGSGLGLAPRRRAHAGADDRHLQRDVRRGLVGPRALLDRAAPPGSSGVRAAHLGSGLRRHRRHVRLRLAGAPRQPGHDAEGRVDHRDVHPPRARR